jgi:tetratricopeptide (TPR) repeat protein
MRNEIYNKLNNFLDEEKYDEARTTVLDLIKSIKKDKDDNALYFRVELHGFLIDIGSMTGNENDLKTSTKFLKSSEEEILKIIAASSHYYNIGNAESALAKIFYMKNIGVHNPFVMKENLQSPIKYYWQAFKSSTKDDPDLSLRILINLSNSLTSMGRIVEALQFLDLVLQQEPNYPNALVSRADSLLHMSEVTNCSVTTALYIQIYKNYESAIRTNALPQSIYTRVSESQKNVLVKLQEHNFDLGKINTEIKETQREYLNHSIYRKFCIDNFLTLNEHSLYCNCVATRFDDIQIGVKHALFKSQNVPKLELLLNRLKSEFSFARWTYFQSLLTNTLEFDVKYTELLEQEIITPQSELQRTSYRICYGILDKIALGICKLYNIQNKEYYFEKFWYDPGNKEIIEKQKNIHLNALFSIACDLIGDGELSQFKKWRNTMEHNLLVLKDTKINVPDVLKVFEDEKYVEVADVSEFKERTLHLLQLTRAAIFSFVYCVRLETIEHYDETKETITISFKE